MKNGIGKLTQSDFANAAVNAVAASIILALAGIIGSAGFDVFSADWGMIGHLVVNAAFSAFVGSLGKEFLSTSDGKILGAIALRPTNK